MRGVCLDPHGRCPGELWPPRSQRGRWGTLRSGPGWSAPADRLDAAVGGGCGGAGRIWKMKTLSKILKISKCQKKPKFMEMANLCCLPRCHIPLLCKIIAESQHNPNLMISNPIGSGLFMCYQPTCSRVRMFREM